MSKCKYEIVNEKVNLYLTVGMYSIYLMHLIYFVKGYRKYLLGV